MRCGRQLNPPGLINVLRVPDNPVGSYLSRESAILVDSPSVCSIATNVIRQALGGRIRSNGSTGKWSAGVMFDASR
jgi:hypothetical protein